MLQEPKQPVPCYDSYTALPFSGPLTFCHFHSAKHTLLVMNAVLLSFLIACVTMLRNNVSNFHFFYSFTRELNHIVSPWIAFVLSIYQLLLVAEVFQLALVSAFHYVGTTDCYPISCVQACILYRVCTPVLLKSSEIFVISRLTLLRMPGHYLHSATVPFNVLPNIITV
jgi:hypothetical protein